MGLWGGGVVWERVSNGVVGWWCGSVLVMGLWGLVWERVGIGVVRFGVGEGWYWGCGVVVWERIGIGVVGWWCGRGLVMRLWGGGVVWE